MTENEAIDKEINKIRLLKCSPIFDKFSYCVSPYSQLDRLRKYSEFEDCSKYWNDFSNCIYLKLPLTDKKRIEVYNNLNMIRDKKIINDIFVYKKNPSWKDSD